MRKKQQTGNDAADDAVRRLAALFEGFAGAHGTHGVPERDPDGLKWNIKKTAQSVRIAPTLEHWRQHARGERPLGIIPIREDSTCLWGSIDFDEYDVDILKLVARVESTELPFVPCYSKSGGLHLFLFLRAPEAASEMQAALKAAAAALGLAECEVFPKQTQILRERGDVGNWMVMPYFGGTYDDKLRWQRGVKKNGSEMTLDEFVAAAETRRVSLTEFRAVFDKRKGQYGGKAGAPAPRKGKKSPCDFSDGPPCLQHLLASGVQSDGRKRTLFMHGLYLKRADPDGWQKRLEESNQRSFETPLPSEEVTGVIKSLNKKDYEYTCREEPMRSHCNSALCRTRKYGIGKGGDVPEITGITMLKTKPPLFFVDVSGMHLELTADEIQFYTKFQGACLSAGGRMFKSIRQDAWGGILNDALEKRQEIEEAPEVSSDGKFHELLEEFLTNRSRGDSVEDLFAGKPYENTEEGRHYFALKDLDKFLHQEGMRDMPRNKMTQRIKELGGGKHFFNVKNRRGINTFWVPSDKVSPIVTGQEEKPTEGEAI